MLLALYYICDYRTLYSLGQWTAVSKAGTSENQDSQYVNCWAINLLSGDLK